MTVTVYLQQVGPAQSAVLIYIGYCLPAHQQRVTVSGSLFTAPLVPNGGACDKIGKGCHRAQDVQAQTS